MSDDVETEYYIIVDDFWNDCPSDIRETLSKPFRFYPDNTYYKTKITETVIKKIIGYTGSYTGYVFLDARVQEVNRTGLFIAAPQSHFNTEGLKKKGLGFFQVFETEIKDPIVFRYVRGGIQVLTKWGLEANDPDLVVPKLN